MSSLWLGREETGDEVRERMGGEERVLKAKAGIWPSVAGEGGATEGSWGKGVGRSGGGPTSISGCKWR